VSLPDLQSRRNDIPLLVRHFVRQVAEEEGREELIISPEAMDVLLTYDWPGNIRELQNVIRYLMVRCREEMVRPYHLPDNLLESMVDRKIHRVDSVRKRRKLTVTSVKEALEQTGDNRLEAAKLLGVGRATLYRFFSANPDVF
jgi:DNA-binding NtrC family response regulator